MSRALQRDNLEVPAADGEMSIADGNDFGLACCLKSAVTSIVRVARP